MVPDVCASRSACEPVLRCVRQRIRSQPQGQMSGQRSLLRPRQPPPPLRRVCWLISSSLAPLAEDILLASFPTALPFQTETRVSSLYEYE